MKSELAREFWSSRRTWLVLGLTACGVLAIAFLFAASQRATTQQQIDVSAVKMVAELKQQFHDEVERLRAVDRQSASDRARIHQAVDAVKSQIGELKSEVKGKP